MSLSCFIIIAILMINNCYYYGVFSINMFLLFPEGTVCGVGFKGNRRETEGKQLCREG